MEVKARENSISIDYRTGKRLVTFLLDSCDDKSLETFKDKDLRLTVKVWREKRSLDANAYYWVLLGKLAGKLGLTTSELHNLMLRSYGQPEIMCDMFVKIELPDTPEAEMTARMAETYHLKPTSETVLTGDGTKRVWVMMRGSHTYDSAEFSQLLNGLIEECKFQGIETMTPIEIEMMMAAYKEAHN